MIADATDSVKAFEHAAMNGCGGFAVKLLIDDALDKSFEGRLSAGDAEFEGTCTLDEAGEFRIVRGEFAAGESAVVTGRTWIVAQVRHDLTVSYFDVIDVGKNFFCEWRRIRTRLVCIYKCDTYAAG
jgi:hypothetical protein